MKQPQSDYLLVDRARGRFYDKATLKKQSPQLYAELLAHTNRCLKPTETVPCLNKHIVYCPSCNLRLSSLPVPSSELKHDDPPQRLEEAGLVGFGSFGAFLAQHLALEFDLVAHDSIDRSRAATKIGVEWGTIEQAASRQLVVLAVPLSSMETVLKRIRRHVQPDALVMDVCSVKQEPIRLLRKYLPETEVFPTHPLFGPQSARDGLQGHKLVLCPGTLLSQKSQSLLDILNGRGLEVIPMSPSDHDREMAKVQGLTHFIALGLSRN